MALTWKCVIGSWRFHINAMKTPLLVAVFSIQWKRRAGVVCIFTMGRRYGIASAGTLGTVSCGFKQQLCIARSWRCSWDVFFHGKWHGIVIFLTRTSAESRNQMLTLQRSSIGSPHSGGRLFCFASPVSFTALISTINIGGIILIV
jgi:hypothetical protein